MNKKHPDPRSRRGIHLLIPWLLFIATTLSPKSTIYFTPDDKPLRPLTTLLRHARHRILVATYQFSHRALAQHLVHAHTRGCRVEVVVDVSCLEMRNSVLPTLRDAGIPVFVYHSTGRSLCHHKYAVIDDETWTGSMNWTYNGMTRNQENGVHCDEAAIATRYAQQFAVLKKRCERIAKTPGLWERLRRGVRELLGSTH